MNDSSSYHFCCWCVERIGSTQGGQSISTGLLPHLQDGHENQGSRSSCCSKSWTKLSPKVAQGARWCWGTSRNLLFHGAERRQHLWTCSSPYLARCNNSEQQERLSCYDDTRRTTCEKAESSSFSSELRRSNSHIALRNHYPWLVLLVIGIG